MGQVRRGAKGAKRDEMLLAFETYCCVDCLRGGVRGSEGCIWVGFSPFLFPFIATCSPKRGDDALDVQGIAQVVVSSSSMFTPRTNGRMSLGFPIPVARACLL